MTAKNADACVCLCRLGVRACGVTPMCVPECANCPRKIYLQIQPRDASPPSCDPRSAALACRGHMHRNVPGRLGDRGASGPPRRRKERAQRVVEANATKTGDDAADLFAQMRVKLRALHE